MDRHIPPPATEMHGVGLPGTVRSTYGWRSVDAPAGILPPSQVCNASVPRVRYTTATCDSPPVLNHALAAEGEQLAAEIRARRLKVTP